MSKKMYEALEICLHALETGTDPESVLKLFPEMSEELLPLLETSRQARLLAIPAVPEDAFRRNKVRVLGQAARMRETRARSRRQRAIFTFPRLAVSLAIAFLFLFSGTGLVRASSGALPGDNLYPVKRTWEDVRLMLVFDSESREELESEFEQERLHEVDELLAEGRHETIKFAGVVTQQNGDQWVVSGVPVQITPESRLPGTPITLGASITLEGRTNAQGFVEAAWVEILGSNIVLPTGVPTEIETHEDNVSDGNPSQDENDNDHQGEDELEPSPDEIQSDHDNDQDEIDDHSNGNSGMHENSNEDHSEDKNENSSSGGEHDGSVEGESD